jgi:ribosomal protein S18 acetylase RimI-like enzyme
MIALLEELAANAWPAAVNQAVDGWILRYASGVSRRANSVFALRCEEGDLDARIAVAEAFYARRGLPGRFHISPAVAPSDLDARLAERGYHVDAPTWVRTAPLAQVRERAAGDPRFEISLLDAPDEAWFEIYHLDHSHLQRDRAVRADIMARTGPPSGFALVRLNGRPIAAGQGVTERGWLGLFSLVTHPNFRRQGAGTAMIRALAEWGAGQGAEDIYLQVMETSTAALSLYNRLGFQALYQYYYREQTS